MARFSQEFLDDLRARVPVSEVVRARVRLRKAGREWKGLSCFNKEKTPSLFVNDQKQAWFDFSSGKNGNIFDFLMQTEGVGFPEAVERIASMAGVPLPNVSPDDVAREQRRRSLREVLEAAAAWFQGQLGEPAGEAAREYLAGRGVDGRMIERFRIGFAPDQRFALKESLGARGIDTAALVEAGLLIHGDDIPLPYDRFRGRVMFPIEDARGRVVAFGGRALDEAAPAKYLNSPETPLFHKGATLYNLHRARAPAFKGEPLIVVEGYLDVIAVDGAGFEACVAPLGTALGAELLAALWRASDEAVICFDGDEAGERAMSRVIDEALPAMRTGKSLRFVRLPAGKDPDEVVRAGGREALKRLVDDAAPFVDALWTRETSEVMQALTTPDKRAVFEERIKRVVAQIGDEALRKHYGEELLARTRTLLAAPRDAVGGPPARRHRSEHDYEDPATGALLYQVVTFEPAGAALRRPVVDEDGVWVWGLVAGEYMRQGPGRDWFRYNEVQYVEWGCRERRTFPAVEAMVPYAAAKVAQAVADGLIVWLARSEDVADALADRSLDATAAAGGTRGIAAIAERLRGADVIVLAEHDEEGRQFAHAATAKLRGVAGRIRVLDVSQFWTSCPQGGGLADWWDAGGAEEDLYRIVDQVADWRPEPPRSNFGALRFIDIDLPAREHAWLVKGILTQAEMSFLSGAWQSTKSFKALDVGFTIARAVDEPELTYFGRRVQGGLVLYQAGEGKLGLRKRMRAYREYHKIARDRDLPLVLMPREINLHVSDDHTDKFIAEGRAWSAYYGLPVALTVIDTFSKATTGANENASEDMSRVLDRGAKIMNGLGSHLMFVHHLNAGGTKVRGHSSLMGNVENAVEITRLDKKESEEVGGRTITRDVIEAKVTKQKDGEPGARWTYVLKQVVIGRDDDGEAITSAVVVPTNEVVMPAESHARKDNVGIMLTPARVIFFRDALLAALAEDGEAPPSSLKLPGSIDRVVDWRHVWAAYKRATPDDDADKQKTYVRRFREFFQSKQIMGVHVVDGGPAPPDGGAKPPDVAYVWTTGKPVFGGGFAWPTKRREAERRTFIDPATGDDMTDDLPF